MVESDGEYIQEGTDDEDGAHQVTRGAATAGPGTRGGGWEVTRTWEKVIESEDGTINSTVEELLEAGKRNRLLKDTTPLQRGIIRHLLLIIDLSSAMLEKDLRPTRYLLTLRYSSEFVTEFFEQNPISQLGIIGMRDGLAVRISDMSGNPTDHINNLRSLQTEEPKGNPSLQNALEMGRAALFHAPAHGTREILILFGSLLSSDPGDIHQTITALTTSHITCCVIGLAAQVAICRTLVSRTNPSLSSAKTYCVALNEVHYRELLMRATTPPATSSDASNSQAQSTIKSSLLMMGFPSRIVDPTPTLCACHSRPTRGGYLCSRCSSKVCSLPTSCPACGLTLILSTHLARSYHHLFPLQNWSEVSWHQALQTDQKACFGCQTAFSEKPTRGIDSQPILSPKVGGGKARTSSGKATVPNDGSSVSMDHPNRPGARDGVSESGRYACGNCGRFFCIDCDVFAHEVVHNCPGCQSREGILKAGGGSNGHGNGEMDDLQNGGKGEMDDLQNGDDGEGMEME